MGSTWNRNVNVDGAGTYLVVTKTGSNPPPPPPPGGGSRKDTKNIINVYKVDRGGVGAKIIYHAKGDVKLTGIALKVGSEYPGYHLKVRVNKPGKTMTLTVTKASDALKTPGTLQEWDYYVQGGVNGVIKQTKDPRLRNHAG